LLISTPTVIGQSICRTGEEHEIRNQLGGTAQIALKEYPRLMYVVSIEAKRCSDLRKIGSDTVLPGAALDPDDLAASQEIGDYLAETGIDAVIYPSVVSGGANIVVFRDADPPAKVEITNQDEILDAIRTMAKRIPK
jgi:hypothetical protein